MSDILLFLITVFNLWLVTMANNGYLVTCPSVFRPAVEEVVSVTILQPTEPIQILAKLYTEDGKLLAKASEEIMGKGVLRIQVPRDARGRATLKVCGNCQFPKEGTYSFYNSTVIDIEDSGTAVFIQTDKPIYKPGQRVYINILTTGPDLKPVDDKMLAYVMEPKGSRIIQWADLKPLCCGLVNTSFPLSDQPTLGKWTIFAEVQGVKYNRTFEVQKYVAPKFEVIIEAPPYVDDWTKCHAIKIRARYLYGKEVIGNISSSVTVKGTGYYEDYKGLKVVTNSMIRGVVALNVCVSDLFPYDSRSYFRGVLSIRAVVTALDGNTAEAIDESCAVNKQLVDLEFSQDTRKHFKPGLPYRGKVLVYLPDGSPGDDITVQVAADVNGDRFSEQELVSKNGQVFFEFPPLPVMAQSVWIDAKVIKVYGKDVRDSYFSSYLSITSWYSPSKCHLLVESREDSYKIGDLAKFKIWSTCQCNFMLYYEVLSRGNIVTSGKHKVKRPLSRHSREAANVTLVTFQSKSPDPTPISTNCHAVLTFPITAAMAPFGRLLVYYVKDTGEGVADTVRFDVQPGYENKISLALPKTEVGPGDVTRLRVSTKPASCVCLAAVDRSVYLLKPGYQLTTAKVFEELKKFDVTADQTDDTYWWGISRRRKKRSTFPWWTFFRSRDAKYAFEEAGLIILTDKVSLNHKQDPRDFQGPLFQSPFGGTFSVAALTSSFRNNRRVLHRKRTYFPETWIWSCFNTSSSKHTETLRVRAPDSVTTWNIEAISISQKYGLAVADSAQLKTFKSFFVDFSLPYSVIRGEQVTLPLTVYNYQDSCAQIYLKLKGPGGIKFVATKHHTHSLSTCIGSGEIKTIPTVMQVNKLGYLNLTVHAEAYADTGCCAGKPSSGERSLLASDYVARHVLCEPEGVPKFYTHTVFFCPNERIHISTPDKFHFQYLKKPDFLTTFSFSVKARHSAHIALSAIPADNKQLLEIVLGGKENTLSWIAEGKQGAKYVTVSTRKIISADVFSSFWISWTDGLVQVGKGEKSQNGSIIMEYQLQTTPVAKYIGFSTDRGSRGEFRVWKKKDSGSVYQEVFHLGIPQNYVPGSERADAKMIGDVMGPTLSNLDKLLRLPFGCGEQNMVHFAPNVFVLKYLETTKQLTDKVKEKTLDYLIQGYQRQLTYKRSDGSYSAFGDGDSSGSMWLTAFVLKSFAQSRSFIYVDPKEITDSKDWIVSKQQRDGSFPPIGRVMNKAVQSELQGPITLTAYVVTALLEIGVKTKEEKMCITSARSYLETKVHQVSDPYSTALCAYALTLLGSDHVVNPLRKLAQMAIKKDGQTFWRLVGRSRLEDFFMALNDDNRAVSSAEIEMASYALLTYTAQGDIATALPIVKWLSRQRNSLGGFSSTQDTCVALQALSEYATLAYTGKVNLTISMASTNMDLPETKLTLHEENSEILQTARIPSIPTGLFVSAVGEGCALLQIDVRYNIPDPSQRPSFKLHLRVSEDKSTNEVVQQRRNHKRSIPASHVTGEMKVNIEACTKWLHAGSSNMAVVEASLLTGFTPERESLEKLLNHQHLRLKRYEIDGRKVLFYFDEIPNSCWTCINFEAYRSQVVGKTRPAPVRVYDYYEPAYESTVFYSGKHLGVVARELCEGDSCNEISEEEEEQVQDEDCNSVFGCYHSSIKEEDRCSCYRDCRHSGPRVCGSDGVLYPNKCRMEVEACSQGVHIEAVPLMNCDGMKQVTDLPQTTASSHNSSKVDIVKRPGEVSQVDAGSGEMEGSGDVAQVTSNSKTIVAATTKPLQDQLQEVKPGEEDYAYYDDYYGRPDEIPADDQYQYIFPEPVDPRRDIWRQGLVDLRLHEDASASKVKGKDADSVDEVTDTIQTETSENDSPGEIAHRIQTAAENNTEGQQMQGPISHHISTSHSPLEATTEASVDVRNQSLVAKPQIKFMPPPYIKDSPQVVFKSRESEVTDTNKEDEQGG
ncbi:C3 and PZP-like alpha-2-macroglobulin domain-containing protein 8 [Lingula anatina]|uniref:C3 and PZP-like alpha-2-macroglobulin domain-containing protein 8 n=1 Tax=Lingula anatina TaxID=7574 RepID=A0A1S3IWT1_LINAN|nr:C3 and PZP-like alpha-2-macroglobulin domain-containing protein 8 [Lingula anatina]|eukprot:XP_013402650.1 C3 and PZP-like alpha-2-macroglobulin domain-containing protein 8 [Lingula anatina]